jgi:hypothetical protein
MASIQIPNLPAAIGLSGTELFEAVQSGSSVKVSLSQIIAALGGTVPLPVSSGGTGFSTYTIGDILYASASQTFSKLADVATGNAIISGGVGAAPSYGKIGLTTHVDGVLPVANGGTNQSAALTQYGMIYGNTTTSMASTAAGTSTTLLHGNASGAPTWSAVSLTADVTGILPVANGGSGTSSTGTAYQVLHGNSTWSAVSLTTDISGTLPVANGGTNITSYAIGDLLYASTAGILSKLADVATGNALISGGVGAAPSYGKIGLTTHVSGTLPVGNGGTGQASNLTQYGVVYGSTTTAMATSAAGTTTQVLHGNASGAPTFGAVSLTADVSGTLPVANGGTGVTTSTGTGSVVLSDSPAFTGQASFADGSAAAPSIAHTGDLNAGLFFPAADTVAVSTAGTERMRIDANGSLLVGGTSSLVSTTKAQITSANTGVNTGTGGQAIVAITSDAYAADKGASLGLGGKAASGGTVVFGTISGRSAGSGNSGYLQFATLDSAGTMSEAMRIDASGNLGLRVTPSAWISTFNAIQVGSAAGFVGSSLTSQSLMTANSYYGVGGLRYINTAQACFYQQYQGVHSWFNAPSGTAGNVITFTQAMTLDASGNLGIGTTSPGQKLDVNGLGRMRFSSGTGAGHFLDTTSTANRYFVGTDSSAESWRIYDSIATANRIILDSSGNVGIGTSSPASKLDVNGIVRDQAGDLRDLVNSSKTAAYVPAATDNGKLINITTGGITINASVFSAGQNVTIYNNSASSQTITQGTSVTMYLAGTATTGNRTLAQRGIATILCVASNTFVCSGAGVT